MDMEWAETLQSVPLSLSLSHQIGYAYILRNTYDAIRFIPGKRSAKILRFIETSTKALCRMFVVGEWEEDERSFNGWSMMCMVQRMKKYFMHLEEHVYFFLCMSHTRNGHGHLRFCAQENSQLRRWGKRIQVWNTVGEPKSATTNSGVITKHASWMHFEAYTVATITNNARKAPDVSIPHLAPYVEVGRKRVFSFMLQTRKAFVPVDYIQYWLELPAIV